MTARIIHGDCLEVMPTLALSSVDAIVCDPPYGLSFMGKHWDHGVPGVPFWEAALRVVKPGAHLVAFGGSRTYHRLTCAIEDAGWEIRDCLSWLYGSGFPKSHDVSKAMDRAGGAERAVVEERGASARYAMTSGFSGTVRSDDPATDARRQWQGWGTALKPAWEPIIVARKPLIGTVAANVAAHGTGGLNIDGCRIGSATLAATRHGVSRLGTFEGADGNVTPEREGRWPANVVLDEAAAALLDEQSGERESSPFRSPTGIAPASGFGGGLDGYTGRGYSDTGGASRFFYTAKAARSERDAGLQGVALAKRDASRADDLPGGDNPRNRGAKLVANSHPTVKPVDLMRWLCRLVTPPGGLILDPFTGSGTTGCAAELEGFDSVLIEREAEYIPIIEARVAHYRAMYQPALDLGGAA